MPLDQSKRISDGFPWLRADPRLLHGFRVGLEIAAGEKSDCHGSSFDAGARSEEMAVEALGGPQRIWLPWRAPAVLPNGGRGEIHGDGVLASMLACGFASRSRDGLDGGVLVESGSNLVVKRGDAEGCCGLSWVNVQCCKGWWRLRLESGRVEPGKLRVHFG